MHKTIATPVSFPKRKETLSSLTVLELKSRLRMLQLPVSGRKQEMVERIKKYEKRMNASSIRNAKNILYHMHNSPEFMYESLRYISSKYSSIASMVTMKKTPIVISVPREDFEIIWECQSEDEREDPQCKLIIPDKVLNGLSKCIISPKRFCFGTFSLEFYLFGERSGHANAFIIDKVNKTLERFEPYGCVSPPEFIQKQLDIKLQKWSKQLGFKYIPPSQLCINIGLQNIQEKEEKKYDGFCQVWSLWYIEERIKNPDLDPQVIQKRLVSDQKSISAFIRNFAKYLRRRR